MSGYYLGFVPRIPTQKAFRSNGELLGLLQMRQRLMLGCPKQMPAAFPGAVALCYIFVHGSVYLSTAPLGWGCVSLILQMKNIG